jgi:spermidine synthase
MRRAAVLLGVVSMTAQAALFREMLAVFRGGEFMIGVALLFWLCWTAIGSGIIGRFAIRTTDPGDRFHTLFPWYGASGFAGVAAFAWVPRLAGITSGALIPYDLQIMAAAVLFAPFTIVGGVLFALAAASLEQRDIPTSGTTYTLEAAGGAVSGLIVSLLVIPLVSNHVLAAVCPLVAIIAVMFHSHARRRYSGAIARIAAPVLLMVVAAIAVNTGTAVTYRGQDILEQVDTRYGRLVVTARDEIVTFYADAAPLFSVPDPERAEFTAHIPMLVTPAPTSVLILGGGPGGVSREVLKHPDISRLTCVTINPAVFGLADRWLGTHWRDDLRVETLVSDGRAYLADTTHRFDTIIMALPPPLSVAANRYYTREFFQLCAARLSHDGVLGFSLPGAEHYLSDTETAFLAGIRETLSEVFPSVTVLPGERCRFLASPEPGALDGVSWRTLEEERTARGLDLAYVRDYHTRFLFSADARAALDERLSTVSGGAPNTDTKPVGHLLATLVSGGLDRSRSVAWLGNIAQSGRIMIGIAILCAIIGLGALWPGRHAGRRTIVGSVMTVGFTEISLAMLAIMVYQSLFGYLYGRITLVTGSYMAGLALGGWLGTRTVLRGRTTGRLLAMVQAGIALIPAAWAGLLYLHAAIPGHIVGLEASVYLLTSLAGLAGGFQFPLADTRYRSMGSDARAGSPGSVYAIDLAGSSLGALITGALLIPVLGMPTVLAIMATLNALMALALFIRLPASHDG